MRDGLRHFAFVGLLFALLLGWLLTVAVQPTVTGVVADVLGLSAESYGNALLGTAVSLALVATAISAGNLFYSVNFASHGLQTSALGFSSFLYWLPVFPFPAFDLFEATDKIGSHLSYSLNHPGEAFKLISLPLVRLTAFPVVYFLAGRLLIRRPARGFLSERPSTSSGA